jgi:hypothetical protein
MRRLPHEALEDGRETRLVAEPGRQGDLDCGNALAWQYSSAPDPATQQVFVRPEPGLHAESRHEMDPRQAGRRRDFGEADVLIGKRSGDPTFFGAGGGAIVGAVGGSDTCRFQSIVTC